MVRIRPNGQIKYDRITRPVEVQANYLASMQDDSIVDDVINIYTGAMPWNWDWKYWKTEKWWKVWKLWSNPPCSHTEVGYWLDGELWLFSSTSRKELGGKNGTRWIKGSELLRHPGRWKLQESEILTPDQLKQEPYLSGVVVNEEIQERIKRANSLIGLGYDFVGVGADFVNPVRVFIKKQLTAALLWLKKIYCSKAVHAVQTGIIAVFSPRRKFKWAEKNGYKLIEDTALYLGPSQQDINNIIEEVNS